MNYKLMNVILMYAGAIFATVLILVDLFLTGFIVYAAINVIVYHIDTVVDEADKIDD